MTHALMRGGPEHLGWGVDRHLAASEYDALNLNTIATGNWAKKAPDLPGWPRPDTAPAVSASKPVEKKKPVSVRDLHAQMSTPRR